MHTETRFELIKEKIFRDQVCFKVYTKGVVDELSLKVYCSHLEVDFFPDDAKDRDNCAPIHEVCNNIRKKLKEFIKSSLRDLHYNEEIVKPQMWLRCENCSKFHKVLSGNRFYCNGRSKSSLWRMLVQQ